MNQVSRDSPISDSDNGCFNNINLCQNGMCGNDSHCICNEYYTLKTNSDYECHVEDNIFDYCMNGYLAGSYWCNCNSSSATGSYNGDQCYIRGPCSENNECSNGSCVLYYDEGTSYMQSVCIHPLNVTEPICENSTSSPSISCVHGTPSPCGSDFYCACGPNAYGTYCDVKANPCYVDEIYYCHNGGNCTSKGDNASCTCPPNWTGQRCEEVISSDCSTFCHNGECTFNGTSFICNCYPGYTGPDCSVSITFRFYFTLTNFRQKLVLAKIIPKMTTVCVISKTVLLLQDIWQKLNANVLTIGMAINARTSRILVIPMILVEETEYVSMTSKMKVQPVFVKNSAKAFIVPKILHSVHILTFVPMGESAKILEMDITVSAETDIMETIVKAGILVSKWIAITVLVLTIPQTSLHASVISGTLVNIVINNW